MKKVLITGAKGFIGRNLIERMDEFYQILSYDKDNSIEELEDFIKQANVIVHLAGSNRPANVNEYKEVNFGLTEIITALIKKHFLKTPIVFSSSTQAELENPYGKSKKDAEELLISFSQENSSNVFILRLTNVFGKWCRPNYNSAVATFCHNIANGLDIKINDPEAMLKLVYIEDVVERIIKLIEFEDEHNSEMRIEIDPFYNIKLGKLAELIYDLKENKNTEYQEIDFVKKMKITFNSYFERK